MRSAVLRVSGPAFDPDRWLHAHGLVATSTWQAGDRHGRPILTHAGATIHISGGDASDLPDCVVTWLQSNKQAIEALAGVGASAELDVGVTVGTPDQFTASIAWTPAQIEAIAGFGISMAVSAYPANGEDRVAAPASSKQSLLHVALVVRDYDEAIAFYCGTLGFTLIEDTYQPAQDKRWVVVSPPGSSGTSLLLARASSVEQERFVGNQAGGRVFLFLQTDDFWRDYERMREQGVRFVREPKEEPYGTVAVFEDLYGNRWDLIQLTTNES